MKTTSKASKIIMAIAIPATFAAYGVALAAFALPAFMSNAVIHPYTTETIVKTGTELRSKGGAYPDKSSSMSETFKAALKKAREGAVN